MIRMDQDKIDSLRRKNVLLLVSDLKLTTYDISIIMGVYKERKFQEGGRYEILWIPIVEQEREDLPSQFKSLQSQMPWYTVHRPSLINKVATKVIKEKWHFRQETILVVLGPQGKVECHNAIHVSRMLGIQAFPFSDSVVSTIWRRRDINWFEMLVNDSVIPKIPEIIKSEKLIFLYASEDNKHVQELEEHLKKVRDDSGDAVVAFNLTKISLFWTRLESCMFSMVQAQIDVLDSLMQDVLKLYTSFKKEGGFVLVTKGSRVVINSPMTSASKVISQYDAWKKQVDVAGGKTLEMALKEHHDKVVAPEACYHFYVPNMVGCMPENVKCPVCPRIMRNVVKFECCHGAH
ncbi:hypothetical protein SAY86_010111 [Trapa natans]|uniref:Sieve element occlusion C-terminal domain-containing protein n=1 Tax=Trapa natans TaxID=22666 RepID=A0AAN7L5R0_TRANT|nr:hypothetical protein SAY86_010111 [Trapa natans]